MQIKVISWNTFLGHDVDGVVEHIYEEGPDIVGLQEIVVGHANTQGKNSAYQIRDELSRKGSLYEVVYYPAFKSDRHQPQHELGNAVLSRFPIEKKTLTFFK